MNGTLREDQYIYIYIFDHRLFQITNLMQNSFILQKYVCYTKTLNMQPASCMAVYRG